MLLVIFPFENYRIGCHLVVRQADVIGGTAQIIRISTFYFEDAMADYWRINVS
jgi:hypothetical protein